MNVDDAAFESAQEFAFQDSHETGEDDEINFRALESRDISGFGGIIELGTELAGSDELGREIAFHCVLEDARISDIAENNGDLRGDFSSGAGIRHRDKVRTFAGAENADAEILVAHRRGW